VFLSVFILLPLDVSCVCVSLSLCMCVCEIYSRGEGAATLRTDVDESFLKPEVIPRPGAKYFDDFEWQWVVGGKEKVRRRVRELLRAR